MPWVPPAGRGTVSLVALRPRADALRRGAGVRRRGGVRDGNGQATGGGERHRESVSPEVLSRECVIARAGGGRVRARQVCRASIAANGPIGSVQSDDN